MSTIAAISTAPAIGGIGIVRLSGKDSFKILEKIFVPKNNKKIEDIKGNTIKYGHIVCDGKTIDEVLVSFFKAPKSYTTEDQDGSLWMAAVSEGARPSAVKGP